MRCPCPCDRCGEIEELDRLRFNTLYCDCRGRGGCSHGICPDCAEEVEQVCDDIDFNDEDFGDDI